MTASKTFPRTLYTACSFLTLLYRVAGHSECALSPETVRFVFSLGMACCGGTTNYGEDAPCCSDLQNVEANGFVEVQTVKRRAKLFKRTSWNARYCALADYRLYLYKDMKGKSIDSETLVIDLRDTLKISVRSYVARQSNSETALAVGCVMTITDRYKRKHKLRFGTGEERQYWTNHVSKVTGKAISDFDGKPVKSVAASRAMQQTENQSEHQLDREVCPKESDDSKVGPSKEVSADEMAEKRRNADDYVKWLRRRDIMLESRERKLCAEIESILPVRRTYSVGSGLNTVVGSVPGDESNVQSVDAKLTGSDIFPETVIAEKLDNCSSCESEIGHLLSSAADTCPSAATAHEALPLIENVELDDVKHPAAEAPVVKPSEQQEIASSPVWKKRCVIPPPPPLHFSLPKPTTLVECESSKKNTRTAPFITKMHEIFATRETNPGSSSQNLRSLLGTTAGTIQFPAYRDGTVHAQCHKLIIPPRPKWWGAVEKLAAKKPSPTVRFKCDRSRNPVWKSLQEKSQVPVSRS